MPRILDGNRVRDDIKNELRPRIAALMAKGRPPGLAVVLAGHNPASEIYVRSKVKTCGELGLFSEMIEPPETVTTEVGGLRLVTPLKDGMNLVSKEFCASRVDNDGVLILSSNDEKKVLHCLTELASRGNVRTETMRAFTDKEFVSIAGR